MALIRPGIRRLFRLGATDSLVDHDVAAEVDEEARHHIELRVEQLVAQGLAPALARDEARRLFGARPSTFDALYATAEDRNQHMRMQDYWLSMAQDLRYAARRLRRDPLVTTFILGTLALGIGANVTAFTLVDRLLFRGPAHVREPERLARIYRRTNIAPIGEQTAPWLPYATFVDLKAGMRSAEAVEAYRIDDIVVGDRAAAATRRVGRVSAGMFTMLGTQPVAGRFFAADDSVSGIQSAIVSEELWRTQLGGTRDVIGKTLLLRGAPRTIIGVAPAGFTGPQLGRVDVWTLIDRRSAGSVNWFVVARLRAGVTMASAGVDAAAVHAHAVETEPSWMRKATLLAAPIRDDDTAREPIEGVMARWLALVSAVILMIACANIVNLLLARMVRRRREIAIRVALGSGRARVARLLLLEGLLLAAGGAVASLAVTALVEPVVRRTLFPAAAWTSAIYDGRALATVAVVAAIVGALVGVIPAVQAGNPQLVKFLRGGDRDGIGRSALRSLLTVAQAALSVILLIGAGLFLRSLARVRAVDLGIQPDRVVTIVPTFPPVSIKTMDDFASIERARSRRLLTALRSLQEVEHASVGIAMPLARGSRLTCFGSNMGCGDAGVTVGLWVTGIDSIPAMPGGGPYIAAVGDDYFATVGTRILAGRGFAPADAEATERVVVVSATTARALWPGKSAIGQCLRVGAAGAPCARVVGVAADVHRSGLQEEASLQYYVPFGQEQGFTGNCLLVRLHASASNTWPALRAALLRADPSLTAVDIRLLSDALDAELRPVRLGVVTFTLGGVLALVVAALGLYSVMAYMVSWRTREIGVRIALGATPSSITRLVVGTGAPLAAIGIVSGALVAMLGGRAVQLHLFETSPTDPVVFAGVSVAMQLVALIACWVPARRATRIQPIEALRAD